jgi:hypothetical protein
LLSAPGMTGGLTRFDTEETEKYPLFSIDLYNCQELKTQKELTGFLEKAVLSSFPSSSNSRKTEIENEKSMKKKGNEDKENKNESDSNSSNNGNDGEEGREHGREEGSEELAVRTVPETTSRVENIPELNAMHLLRSTDNLCCIILAAWSDPQSYEKLFEIPKYSENIQKAKKLSVEGSYSDIIEKTSPNRMYYVFDVLLPNSLENPLLDYSKMF